MITFHVDRDVEKTHGYWEVIVRASNAEIAQKRIAKELKSKGRDDLVIEGFDSLIEQIDLVDDVLHSTVQA